MGFKIRDLNFAQPFPSFPLGNYELIAANARKIAVFGLIIYPLLVIFETKTGQRSHAGLHFAAMAFMILPLFWNPDESLKRWQKIYWETLVPFCTYFISFFQYLYDALSQFWIGSIVLSAVICGIFCRLRYLIFTLPIAAIAALFLMEVLEGYVPLFLTYQPGIIATIPAIIIGFGARLVLEKALLQIREAEKLSRHMNELEGNEITLSKFLKPAIINEIHQGADPLEFKPVYRESAILSCRIRNFTRILNQCSESVSRELLSGWLSLVHHSAGQFIGEPEKWMGEEVIVSFASKQQALQAALQIQIFQQDVNRKIIKSGLSRIDFGLGLSWGSILHCNMGSSERQERTILGEPVQLSARLSQRMGMFGSILCVTKEFLQEISNSNRYRLIDKLGLGSGKVCEIYEVFSHEARLAADFKRQAREKWHNALQHYFQKEFSKAYTIIRQLESQAPPHLYLPDQPCDLALPEYSRRCIRWIEKTAGLPNESNSSDQSNLRIVS